MNKTVREASWQFRGLFMRPIPDSEIATWNRHNFRSPSTPFFSPFFSHLFSFARFSICLSVCLPFYVSATPLRTLSKFFGFEGDEKKIIIHSSSTFATFCAIKTLSQKARGRPKRPKRPERQGLEKWQCQGAKKLRYRSIMYPDQTVYTWKIITSPFFILYRW